MNAKLLKEFRFFKIYTAVSSVLLMGLVFMGAQRATKKVRFEEIEVERINVIEPDGKPAMVLSSIKRFPPPITNGKVLTRSGNPTPGMIFYNSEGDEDGGLVFDGRRDADGISAGAGLMFDQYKQDQTIGMQYQEQNGQRMADFLVWDHPDIQTELSERSSAVKKMLDGPEKRAAQRELRKAWGSTRVFLGKSPDKTAMLSLADTDGNPRVRIQADKKGIARIEFLDAQGNVTHKISSDSQK